MKKAKHKLTGKIYEYVSKSKDMVMVKRHCYGSSQYDPTDQYQLIQFPLEQIEVFEE